MKKLNYQLNASNIIIGWSEVPFDEEQPYLELEDDVEVYAGFSQVIDGQFVQNREAYLIDKEQKSILWSRKVEIEELKKQLADMDYKTNKWLEGYYTEEEWKTIKAERKALRDRINELEGNKISAIQSVEMPEIASPEEPSPSQEGNNASSVTVIHM